MRYQKLAVLTGSLLVAAFASGNAWAVNCNISYFCYRSMTPGPAPETNQNLVRRTAAANNRVAANSRRAPQRPGVRRPANTQAQPTPQQRAAEARRREQQQQREVAERRRRAQQQEQQRLAALRQRQQQAQPQSRTQPPQNTEARQRLIEAQRRAHQTEQRRLAEQRRQQQARNTNQPAPRPVVATPAPAQQSCATISKKVTELNRQAVLHSKEKRYDQSQRLFKAVTQLKKEGKARNCPGIA